MRRDKQSNYLQKWKKLSMEIDDERASILNSADKKLKYTWEKNSKAIWWESGFVVQWVDPLTAVPAYHMNREWCPDNAPGRERKVVQVLGYLPLK